MKTRSPLRPPRQILVTKLRSLGDTVILNASLSALKNEFPEAKIDVAVNELWKDVLLQHPAVRNIWTYSHRENAIPRSFQMMKLFQQFRSVDYDWFLGFHGGPSIDWLGRLSGAKVRSVHFHGHGDKSRFSTHLPKETAPHTTILERDFRVLEALGIAPPPGLLPKIFLQANETIEAKLSLAEEGFKTPLLGLGLGASRPSKIWPPSAFLQIARFWEKQTGGEAVLIIGPGESALADRVSTEIKRWDSLPLRQLCGLLSQCQIFLGNDSGPRHLAAALGVPTITLIGPEHPFEWHPYPTDHHPYHYLPDLKCRNAAAPGFPPWCDLSVCVIEKHRCMKGILPEQVEKTIVDLLQKNHNRTASP